MQCITMGVVSLARVYVLCLHTKRGSLEGRICVNLPLSKVRGRSLTTLTKFCPSLTTYLPLIEIGEEFPYRVTKENLHKHYYFTRLNFKKMGSLQFCLLALLGIYRHPMQKEFLKSCEGFLRATLTVHSLKNCPNGTF